MKQLDKFFNWLTGREINQSDVTRLRKETKKAPRRQREEGVFEIIIVSDNHGQTRYLSDMVNYHDEADYYLHCGDSNLDPESMEMKPFIAVKGNTDYVENYKLHEHVKLPTGEKIWITHGHREAVGFYPEKIVDLAAEFPLEKMPQIILYGHLHKVDVRMHRGHLIINPGSISEPRDGVIKTYAKLIVSKLAYQIEIYHAQSHEVIKEFQFLRESPLADLNQE